MDAYPGLAVEDRGIAALVRSAQENIDMGDVIAYSLMCEQAPPILLGPVVIPTWSN